MRKLFTALAVFSLLWVAACTSPLASLKTGFSPLPAVAANENRLVLNFTPSGRLVDYNYDTSHIKYVVVQLNNKQQQSSRFATGTVTAGTASVVFTGLVAGPWEVMAACYDWNGDPATPTQSPQSPDPTQPYLLYSGATQINLTPGTSIPVRLLLYQPGDISEITVVAAKMATSVTLMGQLPAVLAGSPRFQVSAVAKAADMSSIDTDQRFEWSSDNPEVAFVDGTGGVTPKNVGKARITAKTLLGGVSAFFDLTVNPAIVGYWRYDDGAGMGYRILKITNDLSVLKVRYLTNIDSTSMSPSHYISNLTSTGDKIWQFTTDRRFDFTTGMETMMAGSAYTLQWNGMDQMTLNEAPAKTFTRLGTVKAVTGINWPVGNQKTQQMLRSKDLVAPLDATVSALYFTTSNPAIATASGMNSGVDFIAAGSVTVTARSVDDPTFVASQTYTVDLAAPMPMGLTTPLATVTDTSLQLNWSYGNPGSLPGVNLYRSSDGGTTYLWLTGTPLGTNTYTDSGLVAGQEYLYYLVAEGGTSGPDTYLPSLPTKVLSVYTTSGGYPVVVTGPSFNPENTWIDNGSGVSIPGRYFGAPVNGNYGMQGFDSSATPISNIRWLRAGDTTWTFYSVPLQGSSVATVVAKYQGSAMTLMNLLAVPGVSKLYNLTPLGGGQFKLWGAATTTGTITFAGGDFTTP